MFTYIQKQLEPKKLILETELDPKSFQVGTTYEDYLKNYYLLYTDEHVSFKENNPTTSIKEIIELKLEDPKELTEEEIARKIETEKLNLITTIKQYDSSASVNQFFYDNNPYWIDKATRVGLVNSTNMEIASGRENTTLILNNNIIELPCETVINMLTQIEVYAKDCYNTTAQHIINVNNLTTLEEISEYDYKSGYPQKLYF